VLLGVLSQVEELLVQVLPLVLGLLGLDGDVGGVEQDYTGVQMLEGLGQAGGGAECCVFEVGCADLLDIQFVMAVVFLR
jgi:hypothetical protein